MFGSYFKDQPEEAFSVLEILIPVGFLSCYSLQPLLCNTTKIFMAMVLMASSLVCNIVLEYREGCGQRVGYEETKQEESQDEALISSDEEI